jgi:hypothetical protein
MAEDGRIRSLQFLRAFKFPSCGYTPGLDPGPGIWACRACREVLAGRGLPTHTHTHTIPCNCKSGRGRPHSHPRTNRGWGRRGDRDSAPCSRAHNPQTDVAGVQRVRRCFKSAIDTARGPDEAAGSANSEKCHVSQVAFKGQKVPRCPLICNKVTF